MPSFPPAPRSSFPLVRGDLATRPVISAVALAVCSVGGAAIGCIVSGFEGLVLGAATGWMLASFGDTVAGSVQRSRLVEALAAELLLAAELSRLREAEVAQKPNSWSARNELVRRLNNLYYMM